MLAAPLSMSFMDFHSAKGGTCCKGRLPRINHYGEGCSVTGIWLWEDLILK